MKEFETQNLALIIRIDYWVHISITNTLAQGN